MNFQIKSSYDHGNVEALSTLLQINNLQIKDKTIIFDFSRYYECNPFNNLIIAQTLKNFKKTHPNLDKRIIPCDYEKTDSYLQHLGFYNFFGAEYGNPLGRAHANKNYVPLTPLEFDFDFYSSIEKYANKLALTLSFDSNLYAFSKYIFIEIIRNIYEHANTGEAYMSAQYWEKNHLVEIAIIDSGCGIDNALKTIYKNKTESELLRMATEPGVSAKSNHKYLEKNDSWRNSGYGLYILKRLALEYGGSLMVCSNNFCDYYLSNGVIKNYETFYPGTAIAIRFRTDKELDFKTTLHKIVSEGEKQANSITGAIKSASKSSGGHYNQ